MKTYYRIEPAQKDLTPLIEQTARRAQLAENKRVSELWSAARGAKFKGYRCKDFTTHAAAQKMLAWFIQEAPELEGALQVSPYVYLSGLSL